MTLNPTQLEQIRSRLLKYCMAMTGSIWDAEDLAQETCVKAMPVLTGSRMHDNPEAYVMRIAKTTWIDQQRRKQTTEMVLDQAENAQAHPAPDPLDLEPALQALVRYLSPLQRTVLLLRDVMGYRTNQAARALGMTEGAVKAALRRARRTLDELELTEDEIRTDSASKEDGQEALVRAYAQAIGTGDAQRIIQLYHDGLISETAAAGYMMNAALQSGLKNRTVMSCRSMQMAA